MASDSMQRHAVGDCLSEHNFANFCDLMVLISVENLRNCGSDLAIFAALPIFSSNTLHSLYISLPVVHLYHSRPELQAEVIFGLILFLQVPI
jgi:hypothetical protein